MYSDFDTKVMIDKIKKLEKEVKDLRKQLNGACKLIVELKFLIENKEKIGE